MAPNNNKVITPSRAIDVKDNKDGNTYYHELKFHLDDETPCTLRVGDIVAIACDESRESHPPWTNENWSAAQVLALYNKDGSNNKRKASYHLKIKWFYWFSELQDLGEDIQGTIREHNQRKIAENQVFEMNESQDTTLDTILGHLILTSDSKSLNRKGAKKGEKNTMTATLLCNTSLSRKEDGVVEHKSVYHWPDQSPRFDTGSTLMNGLSCLEDKATATLLANAYMDIDCEDGKGLEDVAVQDVKMTNVKTSKKPKKKRKQSSTSVVNNKPSKKARTSIEKADKTVKSKTSQTNKRSRAKAHFSQEIYTNRDGVEYYYQVKLGQEEYRIGDLVAVAYQQSGLTAKSRKPFDEDWSPAQIVSLYIGGTSKRKKSMMCVKWFNRQIDLSPEQQELLMDTDDLTAKHVFETDSVSEVSVSSILGRVVLNASKNKTRSASGRVQASLICKHVANDGDDITETQDWDSSNVFDCSHPAFQRMLDVIADTPLRDCTMNAFEEGEESDEDIESACSVSNVAAYETMTEIVPSGLIAPSTLAVADGVSKRNFFQFATIPVDVRKCAPRVISKARGGGDWKFGIGDVVCIQREQAEEPKRISQKGMWYPFLHPWSFGQVLSIFRNESEDEVFLEVRWMKRVCSLCDTVVRSLPCKFGSGKVLEFVETYDIDCSVPASSVMGQVNLLLGHHRESGDPKSNANSVPTVKASCKYILHHEVGRLQPVYCLEVSPKRWHQRFRERGTEASELNKLDLQLANLVGIILNEDVGSSLLDDLHASLSLEDKDTELHCADKQETLLLATNMAPTWDHFAHANDICHKKDRRKTHSWKVSIGDVVAVKNNGTVNGRNEGDWYPYSIGWCPYQIIAILRKADGTLTLDGRRLFRSSELPSALLRQPTSDVEAFYERTGTEVVHLPPEKLLGPLTLRFSKTQANQIISPPPFLPQSFHTYGGVVCTQSMTVFASSTHQEFVERGIDCATCYKDRISTKVLYEALAQENSTTNGVTPSTPLSTVASAPGNSECAINDDETIKTAELSSCSKSMSGLSKSTAGDLYDTSRISVPGKAFHVDKSCRRAYYKEINVVPAREAYQKQFECEDGVWTVRLGDTVAVDYEHGAGKTYHDPNEAYAGGAHYPFRGVGGFAYAEIVAIWKAYDSVKALMKDQKSSDPYKGDLEVEIRWIWRKCELPGASKSSAGRKEIPSQHEEVFETDHVDQCTATSLLAPIKLHSILDSQATTCPEYFLGYCPVIECLCNQFWSYHRRSTVPIVSTDDRIARARMLSACISKDSILREKLLSDDSQSASVDDSSIQSSSAGQRWKEAFCATIDKLALTQASVDANDTNVALIGREREVKDITTFLRTAIKGADSSEADGDSKCTSLFVSGPPGTGKTVSVCSIIAKLRHDQIKGKIPDFDFVSLNGMEMRHPFDAYQKFWEAISGNAKERLQPDLAAARLERYFSGRPIDNIPKRKVVVLLLDELDYLVTKKQTVLYNFFDWPKRSFDTSDSPRLVVVGISNTVNLPSLLKPSVQSRIGSSRCDFKSYKVPDIVKILTSKIQPTASRYQVFEKEAILFAAKKVAAVTGDIRKALQICKAAAENVMLEVEEGRRADPTKPTVKIRDVQKVTREKIGYVMGRAIAVSAPFEALVMVAIASLAKTSGRHEYSVVEVKTKVKSIANASGNFTYMPAPSFDELLEILNRLAEVGVLNLRTEKSSTYSFRCSEGGSGGAWPTISLKVDDVEISSALKNGVHKELVEKQLPSHFM